MNKSNQFSSVSFATNKVSLCFWNVRLLKLFPLKVLSPLGGSKTAKKLNLIKEKGITAAYAYNLCSCWNEALTKKAVKVCPVLSAGTCDYHKPILNT